MIVRVEVTPRAALHSTAGPALVAEATILGIAGVTAIHLSTLYFLDLCDDNVDPQPIVDALLFDPVCEVAAWRRLSDRVPTPPSAGSTIEVVLRPGVTDSVAASLLQGVDMLGLAGVRRAAHGVRYEILGAVAPGDLQRMAQELLANRVVHSFAINELVAPPFMPVAEVDPTVETVVLRGAEDAQLEQVSARRRLALDVAEMRAIADHFTDVGRDPTDVELEMLAQTWSEHCSHKSLRAIIDYHESDASGRDVPSRRMVIDSLLQSLIVEATRAADRPWVRSAFVDNAGIVAFDEEFDLAFKVETHNHPSALEPFGGANTGMGGVIRDVMGVGARPIATTNVLCFGPPDLPASELPTGVLHPRRVTAGVVAGIADYGNKMGIPTVNGAVLYDPGYTANPLVYCGCLGILPRGLYRRAQAAGDWLVVLGGQTGRDGLRGATFSSMGMTHETGRIASSAVQIGAPIEEKKVCDALMVARDEQLYTAVTDCGAGGLSSAVGELAAKLGAEVELEQVPLKYPGLRPWEIWLSEAQERMVLAVAPPQLERLRAVCDAAEVEATVIGRLTGDRVLLVRFDGVSVCELPTRLLFDEQPRKRLHAHWQPPLLEEPARPTPTDFTEDLLALLASPEIRSKEEIVRRYDHEVQAGTRCRPLAGAYDDGPNDGAVLVPLETMLGTDALPSRGVALAVGLCPSYGHVDPYAMGWAAVDEAFRNCVAVGADPDRIALLDNICWGSPERPEELGRLVQCIRGMCDAATRFGAPFVSGKDSLHNEYRDQQATPTAIPGTLLVSAVGIVADVHGVPGSDLKRAGDRVYVIGRTTEELGGSAFFRRRGLTSARVPQPTLAGIDLFRAVHRVISSGIVQACHDCSEGGLAVACAEMALGGGLGVSIDVGQLPSKPTALAALTALFSESLSRLVVCVAPEHAAEFERRMLEAQVPFGAVGEVRGDSLFEVRDGSGAIMVSVTVERLREAWCGAPAAQFAGGRAPQDIGGKLPVR